MIPKVIHYCWFGRNKKTELVEKCIASWKKYCPDYEIKEWNESNYTLNHPYVKEAYKMKKWSFVSDYARLDIIYNYGGVYLDTDVELIKSLDDLREASCYIGRETGGEIASGLGFGAERGSDAVKMMINEYNGIHFLKKNGSLDMTPCPIRNTKAFEKLGYNKERNEDSIIYLNNVVIYTKEYFAPQNYLTREINITPNTYSIHHYDGAWMGKKSRFYKKVKSILGPDMMKMIYKIRGIDVG